MIDEIWNITVFDDASYQMVVAFLLLPPAFIAMMLLSVPLPAILKRAVVKCLDLILFQKIKMCGCKFTLYKWCVVISIFCFVTSWIDMEYNLTGTHVGYGPNGRRGNWRKMKKLEHVIALARDETEWWVSLFTLSMYLVLDRFRKSVKHDLGMYKEKAQ